MKECQTCRVELVVGDNCSEASYRRRYSYCKPCTNAQAAKWRAANRDKQREIDKAWRSRNLEQSREKSRRWNKDNPERRAANQKAYVERNADGVKQMRKEWSRKNPEKILLSAAKARAKIKGLTFDLAISDIIIPEVCPIFKTEFWMGQGRSDNSPSLDRINPNLGYVRGNVQVISWRANRLKSNATREDIRMLHEWFEAQ